MDKQCAVQDCLNESYCKELCGKHYARFYRYGTVELQTLPPIERFWKNVDTNGPIWNGSHCWIWKGKPQPTGYGRISVGKRSAVLTHRFSYEQCFGIVPEGFELDHLCRNRICCNPCHLEPVTHSLNTQRGDLIGMGSFQTRKTHCPHGHEYNPENTWVNYRGHRSCKKCHSIRENLRHHQQKSSN